jgi:RimJ/RimL family protein N-acetyltransferase
MYLGKKVRLRALEMSDLDAVMAHWNTYETRRYLYSAVPHSREHEREWLEKATKATPWEDGNITLAIEDRNTQEFLGTVGLAQISPVNKHAEFGIAIHDPAQHGKGYGTDATEVILWIGFHELGLNSIHLYTMESNLRAQRAYEKAGFKRMGKIRKYMYSGGNYEDAIVMDILRSEFMDKYPPGRMVGE